MKDLFWILLSIYIPSIHAFAEFNIYNNDGWIPIIPTNFNQYQERLDTTNAEISIPRQNIEHTLPKIIDEVIEVFVPSRKVTEEIATSRANKNIRINTFEEEICIKGTKCDVNNKSEDMEYVSYHETGKDAYKTEISNEIKTLLPKITRKGKDISDKSFGNKLTIENGLKSYSNIDTIDDKLISEENVLRKASSNVYEVTERLPSIIQSATDVSDNTEQIEYFYEPPQVDKENLTNNFLNILSKYNIKVNDKLPNYALSRRNKDHNRFPTRLMHYPNNLRVPYGYNSLDHLPVDPILAVFLSNYGYYLPGMYGINRDYNNLYGYLASNNMHNNKPFGLYKIYSDTDSSN